MQGPSRAPLQTIWTFAYFATTPQGKIRKLELDAREFEARTEAHKNDREDLENRLAEAEVNATTKRVPAKVCDETNA